MTNFRILGRIVDRKSTKGLAGLRVEAWDKDSIWNDLLGSALTNEQGSFQIEFAESDFKDLFLEQRPDLFFKIFHNNQLIRSTEDSVLWNVDAGETEVAIEVEIQTDTTQNHNQQGEKLMTRHGQLYLRDFVPPRSKYYAKGKFGRLFPSLPPFMPDTEGVRKALSELGKPGGIMDPGNANNPANPANLPAGFTFLGQFIDHDLTSDPTSSLERQNDPEAIDNFRTPMFELDSVYGSGLGASPHLYDVDNPGKFLIDAGFPDDLPRNSQNKALIGDPRNDENLIVSQLHFAFLKFHNAVIDKLKASGITNLSQLFPEAQRLVRWHYQWIVLHEFLPHTVGQEVVDDILKYGRKFYDWRNEPFIPVEFSVAAYRFGHSQVRSGYAINDTFGAAIFNPAGTGDLSGGKRIEADRKVKWSNFFEMDGLPVRNISQRIDTTLSGPLFQLPFSTINMSTNVRSLAERNLLRHLTFSLPSGQAVARAMRLKPLSKEDLADVAQLGAGLERSTPLWFYILREAEKQAEGKTLGAVGGRIVAEVFIGILEGDRMSFLRQDPDWKPTLGTEGKFGMVDLLKFAGVA